MLSFSHTISLLPIVVNINLFFQLIESIQPTSERGMFLSMCVIPHHRCLSIWHKVDEMDAFTVENSKPLPSHIVRWPYILVLTFSINSSFSNFLCLACQFPDLFLHGRIKKVNNNKKNRKEYGRLANQYRSKLAIVDIMDTNRYNRDNMTF